MGIEDKKMLNELIINKMKEYYYDLYKIQLNLPHFEAKIIERLDEEKIRIAPLIDEIEKYFNLKFNNSHKVLVLGGGTGGEMVEFHNRGCEVYVIEPFDKAMEIMYLKAEKWGIPKDRIHKCGAENLPFEDGFFDFVYSYTVIEHVQDVEKSISEAIRVTKSGGRMFFLMPDYRQLFEGHYKMYLPLFLPKFISKIILRLNKRPVGFFNTLSFVTTKQIRNIFRNLPVVSMQIYKPYPGNYNPKGWSRMEKMIQDKLGIERTQFWLLFKR